MEPSVATSWQRILGWLAEHLPQAGAHLQPPATLAEISSLRATMGRRLPSGLVAWLNLNNGFDRMADFGRPIPFLYVPMSIDGMLRDREMMLRVRAQVIGESERPAETQLAGTPGFEWLDAFLPFGDAGTDCHLIVDLRDGDLHGSVGTFDYESGGYSGPEWFSIAEMFADVADSLTSGRAALQDHARRYAATHFPKAPPRAWEPYIDDNNRLRWRLVDLPE
ncbi:SMI1/KNR4 family protein [Kribbella sp. NPDC004138]